MKPEILFLSHRIPYPPDKGDKIRSWRILKFLAERFRVHLCCFVDEPRDMAHQTFLEALCDSATLVPLNPKLAKLKSLQGFLFHKPLSFAYFNSAHMKKAVAAARARPLAAEMVFSSSMAPYIRQPVKGRTRIIDFCDADAEKWRSYAQKSKGPMAFVYGREANLLAREETKIANWADASFAISTEESEIFNARPGMLKTVTSFPNGVDAAYFDPAQSETSSAPVHDCVFTGAMDYRANVDGVLYFMQHVWPEVRHAKPDATFAIVGANPAPSISALHGNDGVTVTGRVEDIRPWIANATIAVAPLRVARGVQNKVLEAMAMAKPVVASPEAMTGIAAPRDAALTASSNDAMAASVLSLLENRQACERMGRAARHFVLTHHQWDEALKPLGDTLAAFNL